jgi:hypothetical protein
VTLTIHLPHWLPHLGLLALGVVIGVIAGGAIAYVAVCRAIGRGLNW